jgi:hypothetical protein
MDQTSRMHWEGEKSAPKILAEINSVGLTRLSNSWHQLTVRTKYVSQIHAMKYLIRRRVSIAKRDY